jgi:hypothetical protein
VRGKILQRMARVRGPSLPSGRGATECEFAHSVRMPQHQFERGEWRGLWPGLRSSPRQQRGSPRPGSEVVSSCRWSRPRELRRGLQDRSTSQARRRASRHQDRRQRADRRGCVCERNADCRPE